MPLQGALSIVREEVTCLPETGPVIIASGPLTSDSLAQDLVRKTGRDYLYFYDAIAPIIDGDSIDFTKTFWASRYAERVRGDISQLPYG